MDEVIYSAPLRQWVKSCIVLAYLCLVCIVLNPFSPPLLFQVLTILFACVGYVDNNVPPFTEEIFQR
jgi:hypothetical protein